MAPARTTSDSPAQTTKVMLGVAGLRRALTKGTPQLSWKSDAGRRRPTDLGSFSPLRFGGADPKPLFSCAVNPSLRILPIAEKRYQRRAIAGAINRDRVFEAISRLDDRENGRFDFGGRRIGHASVLGPKVKRDLAITLTKKLMAQVFNPFNVELCSLAVAPIVGPRSPCRSRQR